MPILIEKMLEVTRSVAPIFLFVLMIHFFLVPFSSSLLIAFFLGTLAIAIGLSLFLVGVDIAITPIGEYIGKGVAKSNRIYVLVTVGFLIGFIISAAEPSLTVLGNQISIVTSGTIDSFQLILTVSIGIAIMVVVGLLRIVYNLSFFKIIVSAYVLILILSFFTSSEFLSVAFDASGATTGSITVPFLLALSVGISSLKKNSVRSGEDSFGLVAIASVGAILAVMISNLINPTESLTGDLPIQFGFDQSMLSAFTSIGTDQAGDVLISILPIAILFFMYQITFLRLPRKRVNRIFIGMVYVIIGLILFLTGVNFGFMSIGSIIGYELIQSERFIWFFILSFGLGMVTILAEPAVSVLTSQIERVTAGALKPAFVLSALALGVGSATLIAGIRVVSYNLELWHILLPGYVLAIILSFFVPGNLVTMAFDAGGVASGPMTGTFILAFIQGAAEGMPNASVLVDGFGMIALVALMPIITIQLFGLIYALQKD